MLDSRRRPEARESAYSLHFQLTLCRSMVTSTLPAAGKQVLTVRLRSSERGVLHHPCALLEVNGKRLVSRWLASECARTRIFNLSAVL